MRGDRGGYSSDGGRSGEGSPVDRIQSWCAARVAPMWSWYRLSSLVGYVWRLTSTSDDVVVLEALHLRISVTSTPGRNANS
jgi:hypothetical protein